MTTPRPRSTAMVFVASAIFLFCGSKLPFRVHADDLQGRRSLRHSNIEDTIHLDRTVRKQDEGKTICFVKSVFGESAGEVDEIPDAMKVHESMRDGSDFQFFVFTNMYDLEAPNWQVRVLRDDFLGGILAPIKSNIVKSRFPKFLAWKIPEIQEVCRMVVYSDAVWLPSKDAKTWKALGEKVQNSRDGVMQMRHGSSKGPMHELKGIEHWNKDTVSNIKKERAWLQSQPNFDPYSKMYSCLFILYDPTNVRFQEATMKLWDHYSKEEGSWRDQPLYSFVLDSLGIEPLELGTWPRSEKKYFTIEGKIGYGGHVYGGKAMSGRDKRKEKRYQERVVKRYGKDHIKMNN